MIRGKKLKIVLGCSLAVFFWALPGSSCGCIPLESTFWMKFNVKEEPRTDAARAKLIETTFEGADVEAEIKKSQRPGGHFDSSPLTNLASNRLFRGCPDFIVTSAAIPYTCEIVFASSPVIESGWTIRLTLEPGRVLRNVKATPFYRVLGHDF